MTDQERLEKCKVFANANDIDWLISTVKEQQKKTERWKNKYRFYKGFADRFSDIIQEQEKEIARLQKVLEFYADKENYITFDSPAIKDQGARARQELESER